MALNRVLLTGAAGFIGYKTADQLLRSGVEVVGIDNINDYYDVKLKESRIDELQKHSNFKFFKQDIESIDGLEIHFKKNRYDAIINLAARAGVRYSLLNPHIYFTTNVLGTLNLLELAKRFEIPRFVLASTSSLYAGLPMPFVENLPVNTPISPYAASKKAAEQICYAYHYLHHFNVTILRYFTVYGPAGRPDMAIFRFIKWIDEGKPIRLFGDGKHARDFTFVDDIARGTILAAEKADGHQIINLGGGKSPTTMLEVIGHIEKCLGKKAVINYLPEQKTDMIETQADISLAKQTLQWTPEIELHEGIRQSVDWYLSNRNWVKNIDTNEK